MSLQGNVNVRLWETVQSAYEAGNYTDAILDSIRYLSELIRNKSGLESDGNALVGSAFGGLAPIVKVNTLQTESEKDEQRGIEQLIRGIYTGIRNPRTHEKYMDTAETADVLIGFIDYIAGRIDKSKSPFDSEQIINRVFDKYFAQNEKYSDLLVEKIPKRKRLDTVIQIFKRRTDGNWKNIVLFTKSVLKSLSDEEQSLYWQVVSEILEEASSDAEFRSVIQISADNWLKISEIARLRAEHRLIESIKEGEYDIARKTCLKGSLGTWANGPLAKLFILQQEIVNAIVNRLSSDDSRARDYGLEFFWNTLQDLKPEPPPRLVWNWNFRLSQNEQAIYNALSSIFELPIDGDPWVEAFKDAYENFQPAQSDESIETTDDDIPF